MNFITANNHASGFWLRYNDYLRDFNINQIPLIDIHYKVKNIILANTI